MRNLPGQLLSARSCLKCFCRDQSPGEYARLSDLWTRQFEKLIASGWARDDCTRTLAHNCASLLVGKSRYQWSCQQYKICPFCWARKIGTNLFDRTKLALSVAQQTVAHDLYVLSSFDYLPYEQFTAEQAIAISLVKLKTYRQFLQIFEGAFQLVSVEPMQADIGWRLRHRVLGVLQHEISSELLPAVLGNDPSWEAERIPGPITDELLIQAVGKVAGYPANLLTGPAELVHLLLDAQSGPRGQAARMSAFYGTMRKPGDKNGRRERWRARLPRT